MRVTNETTCLDYSPHRISPAPKPWLEMVPPLVFEQMKESYSPGKSEPDYQGGLHSSRVRKIVKVYLVYASGYQIYYTKGGRKDPHYQIPPWAISEFIGECRRLGIQVAEIHVNESYMTTPKDRDHPDWFLSVWNHGTPEWTDQIDDLYDGLLFGEVADLFLTTKYKNLVARGRGVAGASAGITAQSYKGRDEQSFVNLPAYTKYTPDLAMLFPGLSAIALLVGFVLSAAIGLEHRRLFLSPVHRDNVVDNITMSQMIAPSTFLRCHCDVFNSPYRGGILTASHVYLEHDQWAFKQGFPLKFNLKRDTLIAYQKKACDDFFIREDKITPLVDFIIKLYNKLPKWRRQPVSFDSFGFEYSHVIEAIMMIHLASIDGLHYLSPFIHAFRSVHDKFQLTRRQAAELSFPVVWQIQPLFYVEFALYLLEYNELPKGNLCELFVDFCNDKYGGSTGGPRNRKKTFATMGIPIEKCEKSVQAIMEVNQEFSKEKVPEHKSLQIYRSLISRLRKDVSYAGDHSVQNFAHFLVGTMQINHPVLMSQATVSTTTETWKTLVSKFPELDADTFDKALDTAAAALSKDAGFEVTKLMVEYVLCEGIRQEKDKNKWDHRFPNQPLMSLR